MKKIALHLLFLSLVQISFAQLTIYSDFNLQGTSGNCVTSTIYVGNNIPNNLNNATKSISLNKGFMATLAENEDGTGERFSYMANKTNITINLAMVLQNKVSFIRVIKLPTLVIKKKGSANQKNEDHAALNSSWFYDWGPYDNSTSTVNFAPMFWNGGMASQTNINAVIAKDSLTHVLAFNEPDHEGQGDITNADALPLYKNLLRIGQRMGSPACTESQHRVWLDTFVRAANRDSLRIDFVADHWYDWGNWTSNPTVANQTASATDIFNRFKTYINNLYDFHKKPIWLTEFNANVNRVPAVHEAFIALALPWLDANPNVERYAYFFGNDYPVYSSPGVLTPGAIIYANHASVNAYSENIIDTRPAFPTSLAAWNPSALTNGGSSTFAPTTLAANITCPTPITRASGLVSAVSASAGYWGAQGWSTATLPATGILNNDFFSFKLNSSNSKFVNYHSIDKFNIRIAGTGPIQYYIDYQVDNGVYRPIDTIRGPIRTTGNYQLGPIKLSNVPGLQDVPATSTVTFRVTPFDATDAATNFLIGSGTGDTDPDLVITGGFSDANSITPTASNADLSALTLSSGTLSPSFSSTTNSYTASVSNSTSSITLTPTRANVNATISMRVNGGSFASVTSGSASSALNLNVGENTIEVLVTAQGGSPVETYTVTITRQSNNADLSALVLSNGTLSPVFAAGTTSYNATVTGVSSITVTPTRNDENAKVEVRINGGSYIETTSGFASGSLTINFGNNFIDIRVTSQDASTTKTYSVNVLRPSQNADLSALTISTGALSPMFSAATTAYSVDSTNGSSVNITATVSEPNAIISVRATSPSNTSQSFVVISSGVAASVPLAGISELNTIAVRVTAQNGTTIKTYNISVYRQSTNTTLTTLVLSNGTLSPTFTANTVSYNTSVIGVSSITLTPTSANTSATTQVRVNNGSYTTVARSTASNALNLNIGNNIIEVLVTAQDGVGVRTYTINITRDVTTWSGSWNNGTPTATVNAVIASNTAPSSFTCKALTINSSFALNTTGITATVNGDITNSGNGISGTGGLIINDNSTLSGTAITFGGTLNLSAGTLTTGGLLRISPTGRIIGTYSNVSGSVTLQQSIIGQRGFRMFANPFTTATNIANIATNSGTATVSGITIGTTPNAQSGLTDIRTYTNGSNNVWNNVTAATIAANTPYALFIRGLASEVNGLTYTGGPTPFTYNVSGTLNTSPFAVTPSLNNFTLVGNPFAAPVNSIALTGGVDRSYFVYQIAQGGNQTAQRTRAGGWIAVLNSNATTPIPNLGVIAYQAGNATPYNITTSNINTTNAATTGLFSQEKAIENLALVIEQNGIQQDNLFVRQDAASTSKSTDSKDLEKLVNENLNFYTINKEDNTRLAVDARNLNQATTTIPVGISAVQGNYTIKVGNNNIANTTAMLRDKYLQTETTLTEATTYNFAITADAASKGEERFELVFNSTKPMVSNTDAPAINGAFTAKVLGNITNNNITLQIQNAQTAVTITVTDVLGKVLKTQVGNNGTNKVQLSKATGMYIVSITDGKTVVTEKVIK